jgi:hypothetical protein
MHHSRLRAGTIALAVVVGAAAFTPGLASAAPLVGTVGGLTPPAAHPVTTALASTVPIKSDPTKSGPIKSAPTTGAAPPVVTSPVAASPVAAGPVISLPKTGIIARLPIPAVPGEYPLQTSQDAVVVPWYDRSTDEQSFIVYRRDAGGNWQNVYQVNTRNEAGVGDNYSWVDTDTNQSGQCYMIAAVGTFGAGDSSEECTVRPDPFQFPQAVPQVTRQWFGLSDVNDGTGPLQTATRDSYTNLIWSNETFGVNLDWSENTSLWKVQAQGGPQVMYGQAVALRVWGGGWLKYGNETWGVDLQLSDTPSYEWYILGAPPGTPVDGETFALWNSSAHDYLVFGDQTWGVNLNWYQKTLPQSTTPPPPPPGVKTLIAYNCISEERPLEMWVEDFTAGTGFVDMGQLQTAWDDDGDCAPTSGNVWTFTPTPGHTYLVRSVDFSAPGCSNDPTNGDCWRSDTTFTGDANGQVVSDEIG